MNENDDYIKINDRLDDIQKILSLSIMGISQAIEIYSKCYEEIANSYDGAAKDLQIVYANNFLEKLNALNKLYYQTNCLLRDTYNSFEEVESNISKSIVEA